MRIQTVYDVNDPRGIRTDEIISRLPKLIIIPRSRIDKVDTNNDILGIYLLLGIDVKIGKNKVYVGQSKNCYTRIKQHNRTKDFWNVAIIIITGKPFFNTAHIEYFEYYCYHKIKNANRYILDNKGMSDISHVDESIIEDIKDIFDDVRVLINNRSYPIFEPIIKERQNITESIDNIFLFCSNRIKSYDAKGVYTDDGFIVLKNSIMSTKETSSCPGWIINLRKQLLDDNIVSLVDNKLIFIKDYIFDSVSAASGVIKGVSSNGWVDWKTNDNISLKFIIDR